VTVGRGRAPSAPIAALVCLVGIGLAAKSWRGPAASWVHDSFAGVVYVVFWIVLAKSLAPRARTARVAGAVLAATCALEALQLFRPPLLEVVRATWLGRALIGTTFSWLDVPHYVAGAAAGALLADRVVRAPR
jgi:hypothetical protein